MDVRILVVSVIGSQNRKAEVWNISMNHLVSGMPFEPYIVVNEKKEEENYTIYEEFVYDFEVPFSRILNSILISEKFKCIDFFCFLPTNVQLKRNWLRDLIWWHNAIDSPGIVSIGCNVERGDYQPLLSKMDKMEYVYLPKTWTYTPFIVSKDTIQELGAFNENIFSGYEIADYVRRAKLINLNSFEIPNNSGITISEIETISSWSTNEDEYNEQIFSNGASYIPFYRTDKNWLAIQKTIHGFVDKLNKETPMVLAKQFIDLKNGSFGFHTFVIEQATFKMINRYAKKHNLKYYIGTFNENEIKVVFYNENF